MALKLKEFDFKGFLLQKGERVGLYAAGGIAFLMLVLSLFLPNKGLLSPSPKKSAGDIVKVAGKKKLLVLNARPTPTQEEELRKVPGELQKQASNVAEDPEEFRLVAELFAPREIPSKKRQNPSVFGPEEFVARFVPAQISKYLILTDRDVVQVGILKGSGLDLKKKSNALDRLKDMFSGKGPGGMPHPPGMPGGFDPTKRGNQNQFGSGGMPGPPGPGGGAPFGDDKKNLEIRYIRKDELAAEANPVFARDLLPQRMVEVVGSFPLKAEIDEFKKALRADSAYSVVFQETVGDKDKTRPAFHFLGFKVQRRTFGPDGKVVKGLDGNEWQNLDLESPSSAYVSTVAQVLKEFAPEDPKIAPLLVHGLYLPRPIQVPVKEGETTVAKAYPDIEKELPKIKETLDKMKEKEPGPAVAPSKFDEGAFNPFGDPEADKSNTAAGGNGNPLPKAQEWAPPDYAVLRFLDLTIQPGQSYEYQVKVRMQNPNWNKPESEVANKQLTQKKELESDWYPVKGPSGQVLRIAVPTDLHLYAVDQRAVTNAGKSKREYKGMHAKGEYDTSRYVPVQVHKWMPVFEKSNKSGTSFFPVGDWVVGERIFASRGELVGVKKVATHVPIWSVEHSQFILAGRPPRVAGRGADTRPTEEVSFIEPRRAPLLVDFEGGTVTYKHATAPVPKNEDGTPVEGVRPSPGTELRTSAGIEILLLTPDGKLIAREAARDEVDPERVEREQAFTDRVAEAEDKDTSAGGKPRDPFSGKPKP